MHSTQNTIIPRAAKQCFSEKAATKKYYLSVVSGLTYCIYASTLSHQTTNSIQIRIVACLQVGVPKGRNCLLIIIHVRTKRHLYVRLVVIVERSMTSLKQFINSLE